VLLDGGTTAADQNEVAVNEAIEPAHYYGFVTFSSAAAPTSKSKVQPSLLSHSIRIQLSQQQDGSSVGQSCRNKDV
jgi:hypothetical protein